ncbi:fluoride efflux transporter CrcB [Kordiimonas pumila]|uniref:Fluoride-specific ion channel FluC n=1 Tax=Kordiimonas pumila TaxID=2161677 RepID=A0ABV7D0L8_9PROT|nr:fluoride efflux transporter CrcB [Kordiimonas pumila]
MQMLLAIAAGGATGALARHFVASHITKVLGFGFPYGTFAVNMIGSLLMGVLITLFALKFDATPALRGFLTVGLLGSFTTFSTFSLEGALLVQRGDWSGAALYMFGSLVVGLACLFAGMWLGRVLL